MELLVVTVCSSIQRSFLQFFRHLVSSDTMVNNRGEKSTIVRMKTHYRRQFQRLEKDATHNIHQGVKF